MINVNEIGYGIKNGSSLKLGPKINKQIGLAKYGGWIFGQVKFGIFFWCLIWP
jgi:hypothetical protein